MLLVRVIARVFGLLLVIALGLLGLGVGLYCLDGLVSIGSARPDRLLHLPSVRRHVGHFLRQLAEPGGTAGLALVCGIGAVAIGLVLLLGLLRPARERKAIVRSDAEGTLAARVGTVRAMSRALAEQVTGVAAVKRPRTRLRRSGNRGRLKVTVSRTRTSDRDAVMAGLRERLEPITGTFSLRPKIRLRVGERGERVQ